MRIRAMLNSANCQIYCPARPTCPTRPKVCEALFILISHISSPITDQRQNLLFAVAHCTVEGRSRVILTRDRGNVNSKFRVYHYRRKNDIILTLFDGEIISFDESE